MWELLSILVEAKFPAPFYSLICSSSNIVLLFNFCLHVFAYAFFLFGRPSIRKRAKAIKILYTFQQPSSENNAIRQ